MNGHTEPWRTVLTFLLGALRSCVSDVSSEHTERHASLVAASNAAAKADDVDMLNWLEQCDGFVPTYETMQVAFQAGSIDAVAWIGERRGWEGWMPWLAVRHGDLRMLHFLLHRGCPWEKASFVPSQIPRKGLTPPMTSSMHRLYAQHAV